MAAVVLNEVCKSFGRVDVIHGISCDIADGEFLVILGPSGCGKSTVLRLVAGLENVTSGEIRIDGNVVNDLEPADRDVAMVFQNYALYPHMSVYNNMAYGLKIRRLPKGEIERRVLDAARILELSEFLDRKPRELSGGQRQRVAMGRCIVRKPKLFLFDEPLSNLDAKLRVQMRLSIRGLQEQLKVTSIYVTHDQVEAMTLADRLVVMETGRMVQIGTPLDIYTRPANMFVAGFIGSPAMNFLPVRVTEGGRAVDLEGGGGRLPMDARVAVAGGRPVILGIRPEHFRVVGESVCHLRLRVDHVELLGADTLVYGTLRAAGEQLTVRLADIRDFARSTELPLAVPTDKLHLFDPETGRRLE